MKKKFLVTHGLVCEARALHTHALHVRTSPTSGQTSFSARYLSCECWTETGTFGKKITHAITFLK